MSNKPSCGHGVPYMEPCDDCVTPLPPKPNSPVDVAAAPERIWLNIVRGVDPQNWTGLAWSSNSKVESGEVVEYIRADLAAAQPSLPSQKAMWDGFQKRVESFLLSEEECDEDDYNDGWNDALGAVLWKAIPVFRKRGKNQ